MAAYDGKATLDNKEITAVVNSSLSYIILGILIANELKFRHLPKNCK